MADGRCHAMLAGKRIAVVVPCCRVRAQVLDIIGAIGDGVDLIGIAFGAVKWLASYTSGVPSTTGTVMLAAIPLLLGGHLLISAFNFDIGNVPRQPLQSLES